MRSLAKIDDPEASELIIKALRDRDEVVRMGAIKALKKRGVEIP